MIKKRKEVWLIDMKINNQDLLNNLENEKMRMYGLIVNKIRINITSKQR